MVVLFRFWGDDEMKALPPKGEGKLVMTSDFITIFGLLKYDIKSRFNRCIHVSIAGEIQFKSNKRAGKNPPVAGQGLTQKKCKITLVRNPFRPFLKKSS